MKLLKTVLFLSFLAFTSYSNADTWLGNAWRFVTAPVRPVWGDYRLQWHVIASECSLRSERGNLCKTYA